MGEHMGTGHEGAVGQGQSWVVGRSCSRLDCNQGKLGYTIDQRRAGCHRLSVNVRIINPLIFFGHVGVSGNWGSGHP